ncbi:MAG: ABC transporter permease [Acidimicrobiales bacterium]
MRAAIVIAGLELRRRLRDRSMLLQGIVAPLVMAGIIGFAFGGGFSFSATIGIVDADGSGLSQSIVDGMTAPDATAGSPITFVAVEAGDDGRGGAGAVERGEVDAAIVLPAGFGDAVGGGGAAPPLGVVYDASKQTTAEVASSIARRMAAQVHASQMAVAATIAAAGAPPTAAELDATLAAVADLAVPLAVEQIEAGEPYSPAAYFGPAMAMVFLFFTIGAGARSLLAERKLGTLPRVRAAPVTDASILVGKTSAVVLLGLASLVIVWLVTTLVFGADWGQPAAVLAVIVGVVVAIAGVSILVTGAARTDAQADGLTAMVAFGLALLGGNFVQPGAMPDAMERLALFTPNGLALRAFTQIGAADAGVAEVAPTVAALVVFGLAVGAVGVVLVGKKVAA